MSDQISKLTDQFYYEHRNKVSGCSEQSCFSFGGSLNTEQSRSNKERREKLELDSGQMPDYLI